MSHIILRRGIDNCIFEILTSSILCLFMLIEFFMMLNRLLKYYRRLQANSEQMIPYPKEIRDIYI